MALPTYSLLNTVCAGALVLTPASAQSTYETQHLLVDDAKLADRFGAAVCLEGRWAFVGEPNDWGLGGTLASSGAVHAFRRSISGRWEAWQEIRSSSPGKADQLGFTLALDGGRLLCAEPFSNEGGIHSGSVHAYELVGDVWVGTQVIHAPVSARKARFGEHLAIDGDRFLVAEQLPDGVHVYHHNGSEWVWEALLDLGPGKIPHRTFNVAISGDIAVIGDFVEERAVVFERSPSGWTRTALLVDPTPHMDDRFGGAVAIHGDWIAVREPVVECAFFGSRAGRVFLFQREPSGKWKLKQHLKASDSHGKWCGDQFGFSLDLEGDRLLVGAHQAYMPTTKRDTSGAAYLFEYDGQEWSQVARLASNTHDHSEKAGWSVALSPSFALVGAPYGLGINHEKSGAAYVYQLTIGKSVCPGDLNSTGQPAELEADGLREAHAASLRLTTRSLPSSTWGQLWASRLHFASGLRPTPPGGGTSLCLGSPMLRLAGPGLATSGTLVVNLDPMAEGWLCGETWNFQMQYRDGFKARVTNALEITLH